MNGKQLSCCTELVSTITPASTAPMLDPSSGRMDQVQATRLIMHYCSWDLRQPFGLSPLDVRRLRRACDSRDHRRHEHRRHARWRRLSRRLKDDRKDD